MYTSLIRPLLFSSFKDPEAAHEFALGWLERLQDHPKLLRALTGGGQVKDPRLHVRVGGVNLQNPIGIAGGFDKNARVTRALEILGFGFVEVGTVTPLPQVGWPRPRIHRFPAEEALVNRMGFPNEGVDEVAKRLMGVHLLSGVPIGVNVGKGKETPNSQAVTDYLICIKRCRMADYYVVNVSSPNTKDIRDLQSTLADLLPPIIRAAGDVPVWVKLAPDLRPDEAQEIVRVCIQQRVRALIIGNTTTSREGLPASAQALEGGTSGRPLHERALHLTTTCANEAAGKLDIIMTGGIQDADGVMRAISRGAKAVQLYTGFIYKGPALARKIQLDLVQCMDKVGVHSLAELIARSA